MTDNMMKWIAGILAGVAWFALVILKMAPVDQFVLFIQGTLLVAGTHGLSAGGKDTSPPVITTDAPPGKPKLFVPGQGGRMMWALLCLLAAGALFLLGGCAAVPSGIVNAAQVSHENEVSNLKLLLCDLPYMATLRHPELKGALTDLCHP